MAIKINASMSFVNREITKKMAKSTRKKIKEAVPSKKAKKIDRTAKGQTKAAEYVSHLLELHKLQGVLLKRLDKEVQ
ncbi:hypothetical protein ES703_38657 [subsurface metagenome]